MSTLSHNDIVNDHDKRNMMLRSMMLDVIFLRRQYAHFDAKRWAQCLSSSSSSGSHHNKKYGLWGPYAKCFLNDNVSLPYTSDSDTSGWFTDDLINCVVRMVVCIHFTSNNDEFNYPPLLRFKK